MLIPRAMYVMGLAVALTAWLTNPRTVENHPVDDAGRIPIFMHTCLITDDVNRLVKFYEPLLLLKAQRYGEDYAEFHTSVGVLAVFSEAAQQKYIPGSTEAAKNKSAILELQVTNVDKEYTRLQGLVKTWVKPPSTQPWGTRSIYFRDPDGNLIDFYAPAKAERH
jgi:catechol 2,3-dioxygenase-like lactoylglutathione lyase family enzyme